jgi:ATP-binding cassette subfamily B protein
MLGPDGQCASSERPAPEVRPIRRLYPFFAKYPFAIGSALAFLLVSAVVSLVVPALLGRLIDGGLIENNLAGIERYALALVGAALVMAVANALRLYFISSVGERILADLRQAVFAHLLTLDTAFFDVHKVGELTSRLNSDAAAIRSVIGSMAANLLRSAVVLVGGVVMMVVTNAMLSMAVILAAPLVILPALAIARRLRKMSRQTQDTLAEMSALSTEMLSAHRAVKSFTQEAEQAAQYRRRGEQNVRAELTRLAARASLVGVVSFFGAVAVIGLAWLGVHMVVSGEMTHGELVQFLVYAFMASGALSGLSEGLGAINTLRGSTERLADILSQQPTILAPHEAADGSPSPTAPALCFEDVHFHYQAAQDRPGLEGVSFEIAAGQTVALVGPSGAGKSTILALMQRLYDPDDGVIRLFGQDIRGLDPHALRRRISVVEQEPPIFSGTVLDNLRFGKPDAEHAEIIAATRAARLLDFVEGLPKGFDTEVGERGVMLSGGQRQRLAIARALLKDAPILLLDEATSALDSQNEALVKAALEALRASRTTVVVAHRLSTIRSADCILVIENGRVRARGTHDTLTESDALYGELVRLQFSSDMVLAHLVSEK